MKRIQRKREKGWRKPDGALYVGRGSVWGNPFRVESEGPHPTPQAATKAFGDWLAGLGHHDVEPERRAELLRRLAEGELKGRALMCWCKEDEPWCHASYLLRVSARMHPLPERIVTLQAIGPVLGPRLLKAAP